MLRVDERGAVLGNASKSAPLPHRKPSYSATRVRALGGMMAEAAKGGRPR
jgi:hypothetical protein